MIRIFHRLFCENGFHVRLWHPSCVYFSAQRQYTAVQKCVHLWNNFPCISTLTGRIISGNILEIKTCLFYTGLIRGKPNNQTTILNRIRRIPVHTPRPQHLRLTISVMLCDFHAKMAMADSQRWNLYWSIIWELMQFF